MSRIFEKYTDIPLRLWSATCDKCGRRACIENDPMELQEFLHWEHDCSYESIFGDGSDLEIDLCQYCVAEILEPYMMVRDA